MSVLREYIEQVVSELARDEKFIRHLKAVKSQAVVGVGQVEQFVMEWAKMQRGLKPNEVRVAVRLGIEKFPELMERSRGDVTLARKMLNGLLNSLVKKGPIK